MLMRLKNMPNDRRIQFFSDEGVVPVSVQAVGSRAGSQAEILSEEDLIRQSRELDRLLNVAFGAFSTNTLRHPSFSVGSKQKTPIKKFKKEEDFSYDDIINSK